METCARRIARGKNHAQESKKLEALSHSTPALKIHGNSFMQNAVNAFVNLFATFSPSFAHTWLMREHSLSFSPECVRKFSISSRLS